MLKQGMTLNAWLLLNVLFINQSVISALSLGIFILRLTLAPRLHSTVQTLSPTFNMIAGNFFVFFYTQSHYGKGCPLDNRPELVLIEKFPLLTESFF